jgi:tetratricopeptide (TPR) repeat protein
MRIFLFTALRALRTQQQERLPTQQGNPAGGYESTIHRLRYRCAVVCVGLLSLWGANLFAQSDPLALQQQAIRRIDDFIDNFRRSGDFQSRRADLLQADAELSQSNRVLAERGDWKNLALGLIKQGTAWRMQGQWPRAIALYEQAAQAAQRAGHTGHHADALSWKALAESSRNNLGQAQVDAMQALRLAEASKDKTLLARALNVLGVVQGAQRDLAGAADTANREIAVAAEAADPMASYYAYLNRSDVYL